MSKDVIKENDGVMIFAVDTYDALVNTVKFLSDKLEALEGTFTEDQRKLYTEWQETAEAFHQHCGKGHYARPEK